MNKELFDLFSYSIKKLNFEPKQIRNLKEKLITNSNSLSKIEKSSEKIFPLFQQVQFTIIEKNIFYHQFPVNSLKLQKINIIIYIKHYSKGKSQKMNFLKLICHMKIIQTINIPLIIQFFQDSIKVGILTYNM